MRNLACVLMLLLLSFGSVSAQEKNGFYVDFSAGFSNEHPDHYALLTPGIGYQLNERWAAGFRTTFGTDNSPAICIYTPYARFTFLRTNRLGVYTEGMLSWATLRGELADIPGVATEDNRPYFEGGMNLGVRYDVSKHFGVFLQGLFLGYSHTEFTHKGAVVGNGRFVLDANWRRAALGVRVTF